MSASMFEPGWLLDAALGYHAQGFVVIPVDRGVKKPSIDRWQREGLNEPQTEARVRELFATHAGNIGIVCGPASGILAVDIDVKPGKLGAESIAAWEERHGPLPTTRRHATPSNGLHVFLRTPPGVCLRTASGTTGKVMGKGIDVQAFGAQVLAPPSVLVGEIGAKGRAQVPGEYTIFDDSPIADCPAALLEKLEAAGEYAAAPVTSWDAVAPDDPTYAERVALQRQDFATSPLYLEGESDKGVTRYVMLFQRVGPGLRLDLETTLRNYAEIYDPRLPIEHRWLPEHAQELGHTAARAYARPMQTGHLPNQRWSEHLLQRELTASRPTATAANDTTTAAVAVAPDALAPFEVSTALPTFPLAALPRALRDFVEAEAEATQSPADMTAMLVLGCASAAIAGKCEVEIERGYREPLNLFVVVALPPAERKSSVFADVFRPLFEAEKAKAEASAPAIFEAQTRADHLAAQIKSAKAKLGKVVPGKEEHAWADNQTGANALGGAMQRDQIIEMEKRLRAMEVPAEPRLLADDVTMERLAGLMAEQGGRICVASAEGTLFGIIAGRYARNGQASFEVLLKGHAGDALRVDRQSKDRPAISLDRPCLTLALAVQPSIVQGLSSENAMRGQGLLARFLYSLPASRVGARRIYDVEPVPDAVRAAYEGAVRALADVRTVQEVAAVRLPGASIEQIFASASGEIPRIDLSPEARVLHRAFRTEVEPRLVGDLAEIADWAGKWSGAVARIAGVLHCVEHGPIGAVSGATMAAAIEIGRYLLPHAARAFGLMTAPGVESDALAMWEWIQRKKVAHVTKREISRLMSPKAIRVDRARREGAVRELVERGYLTPLADGWTVARVSPLSPVVSPRAGDTQDACFSDVKASA